MLFEKKDVTLASAWMRAFPFYAATSQKDTPSSAQVTVYQLESRSITDINGDRVWFFSTDAARRKFCAHYPKARPFQELVVGEKVLSSPDPRPKPKEEDVSEDGMKVDMIRQIDRWISEGDSNTTVLHRLKRAGWDLIRVK